LIIYGIVAIIFAIIFINTPINNVNIIRIQSAFKPGEDASYNTRKRNQKMIQPFLWTHPMGGGLGSTGDWGERFSPGSFLATFPPDSGYMRIVVEAGPVGLAIYLFLLYTVLAEGIKNYFLVKNPKIKSYMLAMLCVTFSLVIANFPQEATGQIPTSLFLYVLFAMICKVKDYDEELIAIKKQPWE
jgi:O-antigen ligase